MKQRGATKIARLAQARTRGHQSGTAQCTDLLVEQPSCKETLVRRCAEADRDISFTPLKVDDLQRGVDQHVNFRIDRAEPVQPGDQPGRRE